MRTFHFHQDLAFGPDDSNEIKIQRYLQAIEKYPEDKDQFLQQLSMLHLTDGQYDKALYYMQQAIEAATDDENRAEYYHFVSYFYADYLDGDNAVLAISNMEKAVELDPESA